MKLVRRVRGWFLGTPNTFTIEHLSEKTCSRDVSLVISDSRPHTGVKLDIQKICEWSPGRGVCIGCRWGIPGLTIGIACYW